MGKEDVSVGIGGDNSALLAAIAASQGAIQTFFETVTEEGAGLTATLDDIKGKFSSAFEFTGIALATEAISQFSEMIEKVGSKAIELRTVSDVLDVTTDQLQVMQGAAEKTGVASDTLTHAAEKLVDILKQARDGTGAAIEKLRTLGVTTEQINDPTFKLNDLLQVLHDRLNSAATAQDTMNELISVLGAKAAMAAEALKLYDGSAQAVARALAAMNGLSAEQVKQGAELGVTWHEVGTQYGNASDKGLLFMASVGQWIEAHSSLARAAGGMMQAMGGESTPAAAPQSSNTFEAIQQQADAAMKATSAAIASQSEALMNGLTESEMEAAKQAVAASKEGTAERLEAAREYAELASQFYGKDTVDTVKKANAELASAQRSFTDQELSNYAAQTRAMEAAGNARLALARLETQADSDYLASQQRIQDAIRQMTLTGIEFNKDLVQQRVAGDKMVSDAAKKAAQDFEAQWRSTANGVINTFNTMISQLLRGTFNLRATLAGLGEQILQNFVKNTVQGVVQHEAAERAKAAASVVSGEVQKTAATDASEQGLMSGGLAALKKVVNDAYSAASGAYAATVGIPYIGPVIAPVAAAAAFSAVAAFESGISSAAGGFDIPAGVNPVTQLHSREMVLPASLADPLRGMLSGRGGSSFHLHVQDAGGGDVIVRKSNLAQFIKEANSRFKLR